MHRRREARGRDPGRLWDPVCPGWRQSGAGEARPARAGSGRRSACVSAMTSIGRCRPPRQERARRGEAVPTLPGMKHGTASLTRLRQAPGRVPGSLTRLRRSARRAVLTARAGTHGGSAGRARKRGRYTYPAGPAPSAPIMVAVDGVLRKSQRLWSGRPRATDSARGTPRPGGDCDRGSARPIAAQGARQSCGPRLANRCTRGVDARGWRPRSLGLGPVARHLRRRGLPCGPHGAPRPDTRCVRRRLVRPQAVGGGGGGWP